MHPASKHGPKVLLIAAAALKGLPLVAFATIVAPLCYWLGRRYLRIGRELKRGERHPSIDLETAILTPKLAVVGGGFLLAIAASTVVAALVEVVRLLAD